MKNASLHSKTQVFLLHTIIKPKTHIFLNGLTVMPFEHNRRILDEVGGKHTFAGRQLGGSRFLIFFITLVLCTSFKDFRVANLQFPSYLQPRKRAFNFSHQMTPGIFRSLAMASNWRLYLFLLNCFDSRVKHRYLVTPGQLDYNQVGAVTSTFNFGNKASLVEQFLSQLPTGKEGLQY